MQNKPYLIYNCHAAELALKNNRRSIIHVYCSSTFFTSHKDIITKHKYSITNTYNGIAIKTLGVLTLPITSYCIDKIKSSRVLLLDHLTDIGNIGNIIRSAAGLGFNTVISEKRNSPEENADLARIAAGGMEFISFIKVTNLQKTIIDLKEQGFWTVGLDSKGNQDINIVTGYNKLALVIGAEDKGIRDLVKKRCDVLAYIPADNIESLNAAAAAAIGMHCLRKI